MIEIQLNQVERGKDDFVIKLGSYVMGTLYRDIANKRITTRDNVGNVKIWKTLSMDFATRQFVYHQIIVQVIPAGEVK